MMGHSSVVSFREVQFLYLWFSWYCVSSMGEMIALTSRSVLVIPVVVRYLHPMYFPRSGSDGIVSCRLGIGGRCRGVGSSSRCFSRRGIVGLIWRSVLGGLFGYLYQGA